jgi:hypothetical protein
MIPSSLVVGVSVKFGRNAEMSWKIKEYFLYSAILKILQGLNISNEKQQNGAEIEPQFSPAIFSLTTHEVKSIFLIIVSPSCSQVKPTRETLTF